MVLAVSILVAFAITAAAQTQLTMAQVRPDSTPVAQVLVVLPSGAWAQADIDPTTLVLDTSGAKPVLRAIAPPSVGFVERVARFTLAATGIQTTFSIAPAKPLANTLITVTRGGLTMARSLDYSWADGSSEIAFNPGALPKAGDVITITYKTAQ
jgi:hypothetical protein